MWDGSFGHMWDEIDRLRGWGEALMELAARGIIRPKVAATFKFDDAPKAHHFIQDRRNIGKVLPCSLRRETRFKPACGYVTFQAAFGVGSASATRDLLSFPGARRQRTRSSHAGDRGSNCHPMTRG
jgi:hypothetical protein